MLGQANLGEGEKTTNLRWLAAELSEYARGMKALEAGDAAAAKAASDRLDAELWRADHDNAEKKDEKAKDDKPSGDAAKDGTAKKKDEPPTMPVMPDAMSAPLVKCLSIASLELRGGVLVVDGKLDEGKKLFAKAATEEKKAGYHEPPFYIRPVGENDAAVLIHAKDYAGAKAAYEAALVERPNSGFGLYGLARVAELSGDEAGARQAYAAFLKEWATADETLPEVVHARAATRTVDSGQ
jgi:tetratricopeptide (TPR) repeat protein